MTETRMAGDERDVVAPHTFDESGAPRLAPRLDAIYREHHGFVWSTLLRLGVPRSQVDDACQDVFLVVFRRLETFEGRSQLTTWLFSIARRVAFRHRRSLSRRSRKTRALGSEPQHVRTLEETVEQRDAATRVLAALDALDPDKRTVLVLHVFEGKSGPQIAEMLGLPLDTAYSRIKSGRRMLRTRLAAEGVVDQVAVLEAACAQTRPDAKARRRVAALLAAKLATQSSTVTAVLWKLAAAVVLVTATGAAVTHTRSADAQPPVAQAQVQTEAQSPVEPGHPSSSPEPAAVVPRAEAQSPSPSPASVRPEPVRPVSRPRPDPGPDLLHEEVALIGRVKAALDDGRPTDAMVSLDEHARRFPRGELVVERRGYRAVALCELGNDTQGRGAGRTFVRAHPRASLASRVRAACGLQKNPPRG